MVEEIFYRILIGSKETEGLRILLMIEDPENLLYIDNMKGCS